jgi:hypothetical protein
MGNCLKGIGIDPSRRVFVNQHEVLTTETAEVEAKLRASVDSLQQIASAVKVLKSGIRSEGATKQQRENLRLLMGRRAVAEQTKLMYLGRLADIAKSRQSLDALEHVTSTTKRNATLQKSVRQLGFTKMDDVDKMLEDVADVGADFDELIDSVNEHITASGGIVTDEDLDEELRGNGTGHADSLVADLPSVPQSIATSKRDTRVEIVYGMAEEEVDSMRELELAYP